MKFDENDLSPVESLENETEGRIMILFLESEARRHAQDISDIDKKIAEIKKKFKLSEAV